MHFKLAKNIFDDYWKYFLLILYDILLGKYAFIYVQAEIADMI